MTKYKLMFVGLAALGITSIAALLLKVTLVALLLCAPAFPLVLAFSIMTNSDSALALPISTFIGYSLLLLIAVYLADWSLDFLRSVKMLAFPVFVLAAIASIPTLDPFFPKGMTRLRKTEAALMFEMPQGQNLARSEKVLTSRGIVFREQTEEAHVELLTQRELTLEASPGDVVLFNHLSPSDVPKEGDAYQFPCRYDLQVVLIFGPDQRLKQRYIGHSRLCP